MQEHGWISIIGAPTQSDIRKLGYNLHLYLAWFFLGYEKQSLAWDKSNDQKSLFSWTPFPVDGPEWYRELIGTIINLVDIGVIVSTTLQYVRLSPHDIPEIYKRLQIDKNSLKNLDLFEINYEFFQKYLHGISLVIEIDENTTKKFVQECLEAWILGEIYHYEHDFLPIEDQENHIMEILKEKYLVYKHLPFSLNLSDLPHWVDRICTLLNLVKKWTIKLSTSWKNRNFTHQIPELFQIEIQEIGNLIPELKWPQFRFDSERNIIFFQNKPLILSVENTHFLEIYFDLCHNKLIWVQGDILVEELDQAVSSMNPDERVKAYNRLIYYRIEALNTKIQEQTRVADFFYKKDKVILLTSPENIEI